MTKIPDKESQTVEFKSSFKEDVVETLVAFSNAKGGTVYVGVSDKGKPLGVSIGQETIQNWVNEVKNKTNPQVIPDIDVLTVGGKMVVSVAVAEYPIKPVAVRGKYYRRVGNSNHLLSVDEITNEHLKRLIRVGIFILTRTIPKLTCPKKR